MNVNGTMVGATRSKRRSHGIGKHHEDDGGQVMKLKPLGDRVVVTPSKAEEKTKSGLFIPDTAQEKPQEGKVVAVGPGRIDDDGKRLPVDVKVGDLVVYGKYSGQDFKFGEDEYKVLRADEIYAIVDGK
jgi:chaperonin GroES